MGQLLSIGVPIAIQDGLIQVAFIIITIIANRRGLTDAAAVGIVESSLASCSLCPRPCSRPYRRSARENIGANKPGQRGGYAALRRDDRRGLRVIVTILIQFIAEASSGCSHQTLRSSPQAGSTCADIFSTASSPGYTSASADISAPAEVRAVVHAQHHRRRARARSGRVFHPSSSSRRHFCRWGLRRRRARSCRSSYA